MACLFPKTPCIYAKHLKAVLNVDVAWVHDIFFSQSLQAILITACNQILKKNKEECFLYSCLIIIYAWYVLTFLALL